MNLQNIQNILNDNSLSQRGKEFNILQDISKDPQVINTVLKLLNQERQYHKKLITDMNLELSRSHCYIEDVKETKVNSKKSFNKKFVLDSVESFYLKYKGKVSHCFNRFS